MIPSKIALCKCPSIKELINEHSSKVDDPSGGEVIHSWYWAFNGHMVPKIPSSLATTSNSTSASICLPPSTPTTTQLESTYHGQPAAVIDPRCHAKLRKPITAGGNFETLMDTLLDRIFGHIFNTAALELVMMFCFCLVPRRWRRWSFGHNICSSSGHQAQRVVRN